MNTNSILNIMDFNIYVYKEMIEDNGEDSGFYCIGDKYAVLSVFDGCGGLGAKTYGNFKGKTGAYMASRCASGATAKWYDSLDYGHHSDKDYKSFLDNALDITKRFSGSGGIEIRGSMQKTFPTTLASALLYMENGSLYSDFYWAGDSRGYILDEDGLHQITDDDIDGEDAMSNLTNDGVMTNVVSQSVGYSLHKVTVRIKKPSLIFSATDGCFGYMSTPMEFENLIIDALLESNTPTEFEMRLYSEIGRFASDDYTLNMMAAGFGGNYIGLQKAFEARNVKLKNEYIKPLDGMEYEAKVELWNRYKENYYGYAEA